MACLPVKIAMILGHQDLTLGEGSGPMYYYGEMLRERVKTGMAQARRIGKRMGRPALCCFNPSDVERLRALRSQGTSVRRLAKDFGTTQWMVAKLTTPGTVGAS
jgi:hypothetical protein